MEYRYYTKTPLVGQRSDMLIADDVSIHDRALSYDEVWKAFCKPSPILGLGYHGKKKEKDMDVGGSRCHLCGSKEVFESSEAYKSKFNDSGYNDKFESCIYIDYECGTTVELGSKRKGQVEKKKDPKVIVGKKCIKVPVNQ